MRPRIILLAVFILTASSALYSADDKPTTGSFTGQISDSICARAGSHDEAMSMNKDMGKSPAECTVICVDHMNAKFVLFDPQTKKTYRLSDQAQARKFAGKNVKVTGTLKKNEIAVSSIEPQ